MAYTAPNMRVADGQLKSLGYQQITSLAASTALTVPDGAQSAMITPEAQGVRFRNDGTAPTATVGMPIAAAEPRFFCEDLSSLRFIQSTAGAILNITYYI